MTNDVSHVFLPGLDGTGDLFNPLAHAALAGARPTIVSYPADQVLGYDDLIEVAGAQLPKDRPLVLIAESFSGPIALRYAAETAEPGRVRAVVLCASFVLPPVPQWIGRLVRPGLFGKPPPAAIVRTLLTRWDAPRSLVDAVRAATARVRPEVLASRIREVLSLDCRPALARCPAPLLYLRASRDRLVRHGAARQVRRARGDVVIRTVNGPHLLLQASPAAAWREIERFLDARGRR
jgi:pimeloyl-ACP methyl ester carboxylesterase